jgi:hypothetical protein
MDKTGDDILMMIDRGEFEPGQTVTAEFKAAQRQPLPLLEFLRRLLVPHNFAPAWANFRHLPLSKAKGSPGRPPAPRGPSPGPTGPVWRAFRWLEHHLVRLPANHAAGAAAARAKGAATAERVQAANLAFHGKRTAAQIRARILKTEDAAPDLSTINRILRSHRIKQK